MYFEIIVSFHQFYQEELGLKKLSISAFSTQSSTVNILKMPKTLNDVSGFLSICSRSYVYIFYLYSHYCGFKMTLILLSFSDRKYHKLVLLLLKAWYAL